MKRWTGLLAAAWAMTGATWAAGGDAADNPDMVARFRSVMPRTSEEWAPSNGGEVQARFWQKGGFGAALSLGIDTWTARDEITEESDASGSSRTAIFGRATLLPVGASLLYRHTASDRLALVFETGLKYVFADSRLHAEVSLTEDGRNSFTRDTIFVEDTFLWTIGLSVEAELEEGLSLLMGLGYQTDLMRPHETFGGEDIGATSFQAAVVNFGLRWTF